MTSFLHKKQIVLGVTGSIAAYKSAELVRRLRDFGAVVRVVMTDSAKQFITPLTMQAVSGLPVHEDLFDLQAEAAMGHIELARWADLILIAPASADLIARLAHGRADDLLTTLCLASKAPIAILPAMNQGMWRHALTQENVGKLRDHGVTFIGPDEGSQACGDVGPGRMLEPVSAIPLINDLFAGDLLAGVRVLITAGPTHEPIDPVRYIANGSSGKMGYALAEAARAQGAAVTLVSGPVSLPKPASIDTIFVKTAQEMNAEVMKNTAKCDIFVAVAAVGDYHSQIVQEQKIHKTEATLQLTLERNPDIVQNVAALSPKPFIVGFAAETENVVNYARAKMVRKKMDMIIANDANVGMGSDENEVIVITSQQETVLPRATKTKLANELIHFIAAAFRSNT
jgi:phosphopantothenoylcysteine decarboxylase/phosphopantothenate--cysteine ligase